MMIHRNHFLRIHESIKAVLIVLLVVLLRASTGWTQPEEYNHPELHWNVYDSEHFQVIFHQGEERTAREILRIAEDDYEPITSLYDYKPDTKVRFIVRDHDDYSNGGAYYYDNKIVIWAKPMDIELRGTHNWLRNVVTHEFTHIIQLGASRKLPRWLPAFYFQWIGYEKEKRKDVLYGYPNVIASYPLPMTIIPPWFAEGCAQYQKSGLGYDHWDSHRDMILRMRTLQGQLLSYTEMGYYGKTSYNAEGVYDHGLALVRYIVQNWGEKALERLSKDMKSPFAFTFDSAIKRALGLSGQELYDRWVSDMQFAYQARTEIIRQHLVQGTLIEDEGFANLFPRWSPDGKQLAYTSNKGGDYFMNSSLYVYDAVKKTQRLLKAGISSPLSWSPDGRFIFYNKQFGPGPNGSHFDDLAAWDLQNDKELRLTEYRRASHMDISPDSKQICFVVTQDGTQNLWTADLPERWWKGKKHHRIENEKALTHYNNGEQVYAPRWSPDGRRLVFAQNRDRDRDIILMNLEDGSEQVIAQTVADERDPVWINSEQIIFASDRTGIFNLYRYDLADTTLTPLTNMLGGAFMPSVSDSGKIAYADFRASGYKLAVMDQMVDVPPDDMEYIADYPATLPAVTYPTDQPPAETSKPYKPIFEHTFIYPRIAVNFGTFMPGFYFYLQDVLEKMSAFGGFAINSAGDYDLFALMDYRKLHPTLFAEAYNLVRHTEQTFEDPYVIVGEQGSGPDAVPIYDRYTIKYNFNLLEVDAGFRLKIRDAVNLRVAGIISRYRTTLNLEGGLAFGYTYYKGKAAEAKLTADFRARGRNEDISPTGGYFLQMTAAREYNDFINGFEVNADKGTLQEVYTRYTYDRFEILADKYLKSPLGGEHGVVLTADLGILDHDVDDFFYLYAGGLDGMRGYSYYSLGGTRKAILRGTYNLPVKRDIAKRFWIFDLDKVYLSFYGDVGNAWAGDFDSQDLKTDAGAALKMQFYSFTTFPSALTFDAAYGFDQFEVIEDQVKNIYGKEWRFYFTLLFNFNLRHQSLPFHFR